MVYLIHFSRRFKHAQHYSGTTADLKQRIADHRAGKGSSLLAAVNAAGIPWRVVRTWRGSFAKEQQLKSSFSNRDLCPTCSGRAALNRGGK